MLTPVKILLLALLAAAVWYGWRFWRWLRRFREEIQRQMEEAARHAAPGPAPAPTAPDPEIDDLAPCPVCGTYGVPGRVANCGRSDCPYPG